MPKEDTGKNHSGKSAATPTAQDTGIRKLRTKNDYVELAKERNARVILHNTPDTYPLTDMARYADQGLRRLRNRIMISLAPKQALPLLDKYNEVLIDLHKIIEKICLITNVRYRTPKAISMLLGESEAGDAKEKEKPSDSPDGFEKKSK